MSTVRSRVCPLSPDVAAVEQCKPYLLKARVLAGQKNPTSALAVLTSGLKASPQSMELLFERANLCRAAGDIAGADADQQEALEDSARDRNRLECPGIESLAGRPRRCIG